jgi:3-methyladenine DNA glycosylase Mpg
MVKLEVDEAGTKYWINENDELHREDGPAVEYMDGSKYWCINGKCHREDGPAAILIGICTSWYYNDERIDCSTQEEFERIIKLRMFW